MKLQEQAGERRRVWLSNDLPVLIPGALFHILPTEADPCVFPPPTPN